MHDRSPGVSSKRPVAEQWVNARSGPRDRPPDDPGTGTDAFISVWSTRQMPATQVSGRHTRIDATLDGVVLRRSKSRSRRHGVQRVELVGWDRVAGASMLQSRSGRPVVRLAVDGHETVEHHRDDPFSVKLQSGSLSAAQEFVDHVNFEVDVRRRWRTAT